MNKKVNEKKSFKCKNGVGRQQWTFTSCQNAACSDDFFSLVGRLCSGGKRFDWANVDCKTVGFFLKISKEIGKVFVLEYAKVMTVLQSRANVIFAAYFILRGLTYSYFEKGCRRKSARVNPER